MDTPAAVATIDSIEETDRLDGLVDLIELRLDLSNDPIERVHEYNGSTPLILTNRLEGEGGGAPDNQDRLDTLRSVLRADGVWGIDLELEALEQHPAAQALSEEANAEDVQVIVSAHPPTTISVDLMRQMLTEGAALGDIAKLAVPVETPTQLADLTTATSQLIEAGLPVATMAIGPHALASRIIAAGIGCHLVYAAPPGVEPAVTGQPSITTLKPVIDTAKLG